MNLNQLISTTTPLIPVCVNGRRTRAGPDEGRYSYERDWCVHSDSEGTSITRIIYIECGTGLYRPSDSDTQHPLSSPCALAVGDTTVSKNGDWRVNATSNF